MTAPPAPKHRLYLGSASDAIATDTMEVALDADQTHHLSRVLRHNPGDELLVFDGAGSEWLATVGQRRSRLLNIEIGPLHRQAAIPTPLILLQAWLKGGAMDTVVQKATELGATEIWLVNSDHSVVPHGDQKYDGSAAQRSGNPGGANRRLDNKLRHLSRIACSACEQSGRLYVPPVEILEGLEAALDRAADCRQIVLDLACPPLEVGTGMGALMLAVGPEGGWSDIERERLKDRTGVERMSLGELTLRAETAPLVALSAIRHARGWR